MNCRDIDWDERFGVFEATEEAYDPSAGDELVGGLDRIVQSVESSSSGHRQHGQLHDRHYLLDHRFAECADLFCLVCDRGDKGRRVLGPRERDEREQRPADGSTDARARCADECLASMGCHSADRGPGDGLDQSTSAGRVHDR
jgi:hypothetical protein